MVTLNPILTLHARVGVVFFWPKYFWVVPVHSYINFDSIPSSCLGFRGWYDYNTFIMQTCWFDQNFVGAEMALHESDNGRVPPNHAMEDVDWVYEGSRWICKFNGYINSYVAKWLLR